MSSLISPHGLVSWSSIRRVIVLILSGTLVIVNWIAGLLNSFRWIHVLDTPSWRYRGWLWLGLPSAPSLISAVTILAVQHGVGLGMIMITKVWGDGRDRVCGEGVHGTVAASRAGTTTAVIIGVARVIRMVITIGTGRSCRTLVQNCYRSNWSWRGVRVNRYVGWDYWRQWADVAIVYIPKPSTILNDLICDPNHTTKYAMKKYENCYFN